MKLGARHNPNLPPQAGQRRRLAASGYGAPVIVAVICLAVLATAYNHSRGNFHKIRTAVLPPVPVYNPGNTGPGGQSPIELTRSATSIGSFPQFLSMTLLPGRGLDTLQIQANIPGHGDTNILVSRSLDQASGLLGDQLPAMQNGISFGAPLLAPFAGRMAGSVSDTPKILHSMWQGHWLAYAPEADGSSRSVGSLLLGRSADAISTGVLPDGEFVDATFHAGSFGDAWPSQLDVKTHIDLVGQSLELTMTATNVGNTPTPVGLGWLPHFRIASGNRAQASLNVPFGGQALTDPHTGLPTGKFESVSGTPLDFEHAGGKVLGSHGLDVQYTNPHRGATTDGPAVELRDTAFGYGLRLISLGDNVTALHVISPADQPWVAVEAATNQGDPLGHQWVSNPDGSGIKILDPGQSLTLHLKLEIFPLNLGTSPVVPNP